MIHILKAIIKMKKITWRKLLKNPKILVNGTIFEYLSEDLIIKVLKEIRKNSLITTEQLTKIKLNDSRPLYLREHEAKAILNGLVKVDLAGNIEDTYKFRENNKNQKY